MRAMTATRCVPLHVALHIISQFKFSYRILRAYICDLVRPLIARPTSRQEFIYLEIILVSITPTALRPRRSYLNCKQRGDWLNYRTKTMCQLLHVTTCNS